MLLFLLFNNDYHYNCYCRDNNCAGNDTDDKTGVTDVFFACFGVINYGSGFICGNRFICFGSGFIGGFFGGFIGSFGNFIGRKFGRYSSKRR